MTSLRSWVLGARPRTLSAAVTPVMVGTAIASMEAPVLWWRAGAALVVALALQVGVNYANDYSDGVRGTDDQRVGPMRLTATGLATPLAVRRAAAGAFMAAAIAGSVLAIVVDLRLLILGIAAVLAAATYTGGPRPYGYSGYGELGVLVFFGFAATLGSVYVQHRSIPGIAWWASLAVGLPSCALLLANNIRDIETDRRVEKHTLAVRLGDVFARRIYVAAVLGAFAAIIPIVMIGRSTPTALWGFVAAPLAIPPIRKVVMTSDVESLVGALSDTARMGFVLGIALAVGIAWA